MAKYIYNISELLIDSTEQEINISQEEQLLIPTFEVNSSFIESKHRVDLYVYTLNDILLSTNIGYTGLSQTLNSAGAGKTGASALSLDPKQDMLNLGYESGDVKLLYTFVNNLYSLGKLGGGLFIESISSDRTEIRALSNQINDEDLLKFTTELKSKLNNSSHFSEFLLNFGDDNQIIALNVDTEVINQGRAVVFKLYEPLLPNYTVNSLFTAEEIIADSKLYEIATTVEEDKVVVPFLKGPNFDVSLDQEFNNPTEYFNYNELFSYPITGSNYKLYSLFNEKGAQIAIRYNDYKNFIHFSSAEERVRNFQYKLSLLESYETNLLAINSSSYSSTGISGSRDYWENLIEGLINNFDHYDKHLYFGSGSHSWPKLSGSLYSTTSPTGSSWFNEKLISASNFDVSNYDGLINTIPTFIREDSNNESYLMFIHMLGNHFDNIWVYMKAMSDKYDTDHRLEFGISKDIVRSAIQSFGIKLYTGNNNQDNLFSAIVGEPFSTGSEKYITTMSVATSASFNSGSTALEYLQPVSKNDYQQEIYKRIYHNLPFLAKAKGTERGLRALINCFGIPEDLLTIRHYGGVNINSERFFGPEYYATSSITGSILTGSNAPLSYSRSPVGKVRLDNTGSIVTGSTLSRYTSIIKKEPKYTDDSHKLQVGFNISKATNEFIDIKTSGSFNIDNYIGDPRLATSRRYDALNELGRNITNMSYTWEDIIRYWQDADWNWDDHLEYARDPKAFIRLLNFFDSSLFRMIKDFVPARAKVDTGVIIESHKLNRSKAKQVSGSFANLLITSSFSIGSATGSQGGSFDKSGSYNYTTNYTASIVTPIGRAPRNVVDESPMYTGEFSGSLVIASDGEVSKNNPFKRTNQPLITFDLNVFNFSVPIPNACSLDISASYVGEYFRIYSTGSDPGTVNIVYPTTATIGSGQALAYTVDYDTYEFITLEAVDEAYPGSQFEGWYTAYPTGSATLISTNTSINIYYEDEVTYGNQIYASFK